MALCPACEHVNPQDAKFCSACGSPLVMRCPACSGINVRTRQACHRCGAALAGGPAAAADGPVVPLLLSERVGDTAPDNTGWTLSLRSDALTPLPEPPPLAADEAALPRLLADADAPRGFAPALPPALGPTPAGAVAGPAPAIATAAGAAFPPPANDPATLKANRRAKVRRAQRSHHRPAPDTPQDVLVLEPQAESRALVCSVLDGFGFRTHTAVSVAEAEGLCARQAHVAVFLGLGSDAQDAAALCRRLRDGPSRRPLAIVAMGDPKRHTDRVRMQLAGADAVMLRPVSRGDLARALDACSLALPRDPRQGAAPAP